MNDVLALRGDLEDINGIHWVFVLTLWYSFLRYNYLIGFTAVFGSFLSSLYFLASIIVLFLGHFVRFIITWKYLLSDYLGGGALSNRRYDNG